MDLPPLPVLNNDLRCSKCGKKYKSLKPYEKHISKCKGGVIVNKSFDKKSIDFEYESVCEYEDSIIAVKEETNSEILKLRNELLNIIMNNPSFDIGKPINTTPFERINQMGLEELKARIFDAKRTLSSKTDLSISDNILTLVNMVVGRVLNCIEELETTVKNDIVLRETVKDALSMTILSKIPPQMKVGALYSIDVAKAMQKRKQSMPSPEPSSNQIVEVNEPLK